MGLDWYVEPKMENGRRVRPSETAGLKYLDRNDPESVEMYRDIYEKKRKKYEDPGPPPTPEPKPGGFAGSFDWLRRAGRDRRYRNRRARETWEFDKRRYDRWNRPFETVLEETLGSGEAVVARYAAPDRQAALAKFLGTGDVYDFRANELREEMNLVSEFASNELRKFWPIEIANDQTPEGMFELADEIERSLAAFREAGRDKAGEDGDQEDVEFSVEIVEAAIPWLRFWAKHGHSITADW